MREYLNVRCGALALLCVCFGCESPVVSDVAEFSDLHPVTGRVTLDGKPIPGGSVRLFPAGTGASAGSADVHSAVVRDDGTFEVRTFRAGGQGIGAPAGDYLVSVSWTGHPSIDTDIPRDELPELLPAKYTRPQTSRLEAKVVPGGTVLPEFELDESP